MKLSQFIHLGDLLRSWLSSQITLPLLDRAIEDGFCLNPYFTPYMQKNAIDAICKQFLDRNVLESVIKEYPFVCEGSELSFVNCEGKAVGVVAAGNIPAVAFQDIFSALLVGASVVVKLSSKDKFLLPAIFSFIEINNDVQTIKFVDNAEFVLGSYDALLTMGGDKAAKYFSTIFKGIPSIVRKNRYSVAVVRGDETKEDLWALAKDITLYYGLGCRSVSFLLLPNAYDIGVLAKIVEECTLSIMTPFFKRNYLRNKTIDIMDGEDIIDAGGFYFVRNNLAVHKVSSVGYKFYERISEVDEFVKNESEHLQRVYYSFGKAQTPGLADFPDGEDIFLFLKNKLL